MSILNFGSINIDYVYQVDHITAPGETLSASGRAVYPGGKGANQSSAIGKAGAEVYHAGNIGADDSWLLENLQASGVDTRYITAGKMTGHAIIQVDSAGENAIFLFGGGNREITTEQIDTVLSHFGSGDTLLLQNEINAIPELIYAGADRGMKIVINLAPFGPEVHNYPLDMVSLLLVNETEGCDLSKTKDVDEAILVLQKRYPKAAILMTLGSRGSRYISNESSCRVPATATKVVDTTAAGDTFIGYYLAGISEGMNVEAAMKLASSAAAITVSKPGAGCSIPWRKEIIEA